MHIHMRIHIHTQSLTLLDVSERIDVFLAAMVTLLVSLSWIPDDGQTPLPYSVVLIIPVTVFKSFERRGWWTFVIFALIFVLIPVLDVVIGVEIGNQNKDEQKKLGKQGSFRNATYLATALVLGSLAFGAYLVNLPGVGQLEFYGLSASTGVITGAIGIVVGHELCHKAS